MLEFSIAVMALAALAVMGWCAWKVARLSAEQQALPALLAQMLEDKHRAMLQDLHDGLSRQGDRTNANLNDSAERVRTAVAEELGRTRQGMQTLQLEQSEGLAKTREELIRQMGELSAALQAKQDRLQLGQSEGLAKTREELIRQMGELSAALQGKQDRLREEMLTQTLAKLAEQARADQELIQATFRNATQQLGAAMEALSKTVDGRLDQIGGKVSERLDEGFKKTNETFANVMARLATIDEAQKKIDGLTTNVVSLQELLGDKRSRGAFGEVQLEALVRNILPPTAYVMQHTLPNGSRVDCALFLPEPTGLVGVDSKFPLENYHRMFATDAGDAERRQAHKQFSADVKKHIDAIAEKYVIADVTSDGAVMFVPAEAVFAEIHGNNPELVEYAMMRKVWIVSPTTMMAVLNTARAVLKDVETRKQVHIIKDALGKLGKEFERFDVRMKKLADHIRQAHQDAEEVHITSQKITRRFAQIESVELTHEHSQVEHARVELLELGEES